MENRRNLSVIHMHIMKTAGMSLNHMIGNCFADDLNLFKNQDEIDGYPSTFSTEKYFDIIVNKFDFITGHFNYKLFQKIKRAKILQGRHVIDFTILRDPLSRIISAYRYYVKEFFTNPELALKYHGEITYELFWKKRVSIDEFVELMPVHVDNFQTRFLSDLSEEYMWDMNPPQIDNDIFESAKRNLETFSLIGLQEQLDDFWKCLCYLCGWKYDKITCKINSSEFTDKLSIPSYMDININMIPDSVKKRIEEKNYYDRLLYEYGKKIFQDQINYITQYFG